MKKFTLILIIITLIFSFVSCEEIESVASDEDVQMFFDNIINGFRRVHRWFNTRVFGNDDQPAPNNPTRDDNNNDNEGPIAPPPKHKFCDKIYEFFDDHKTFSEDNEGQAKKYLPNSNICWRIQPKNMKNGARVMMHFNAFDLETGYDKVRIIDLNKVKDADISNAILDDEADSDSTYSSVKGFLVHFSSDDSVEKTGFTCQYAVDDKDTDERVVFEKQRKHNAKNCHTEMYPEDDYVYVRQSTTAEFRVSPSAKKVSGVKVALEGTRYKKELKLGEKDSTIDITFNANDKNIISMKIGPKAPVGIYEVEMKVDGKIVSDNLKVFVVWNPFEPSSPVHLNDAKKLQFYGFQEHGVQFVGSSDSYRARPWNYGCFTAGVLRAIARMLKSCDIKTRQNIEEFTRWISFTVGDKVLHGKWGEPYTGAIKLPWEWEGSVSILTNYADNGQPVKYGQCWVFSGLVTSVSRALGIPCRSVTNFDSAHERKPFDQIVDEYWACNNEGRKCKQDKRKSSDSIWNFHVWNEAWMKNKYHPETKTTWNAFDATPQEMEDGKYQCGPFPVINMFNGECSGKYSGEFICGETNAAQKVHFKVGNDPWKLEYTDHKHVGKKACTAALGTHRCEDVSKKYKDDSRARREYNRFMEKPTLKQQKSRPKEKQNNSKLNVQCNIIKHPGGYIMGTPIKAQCKITNNGKSSIVVETDARAEGLMYNGQILKQPILKNNNGQNPREQDQPDFPPIATISKALELKGGASGTIDIEVKSSQYTRILHYTNSIRVVFEGHIKGTKEIFLKHVQTTVNPPALQVSCKPFKVGETTQAKVVARNPLEIPLTNVKLYVQISGVEVDEQSMDRINSIPPYGQHSFYIKVKAEKASPDAYIMATLDTDELGDMEGEHKLQIAPRQKPNKKNCVLIKGRWKCGPGKGGKVRSPQQQQNKSKATKPQKSQQKNKPKVPKAPQQKNKAKTRINRKRQNNQKTLKKTSKVLK